VQRTQRDQIHERDRGLRRVRRATTWTAAAASVLAVLFGAIFARGADSAAADPPGDDAPTPTASRSTGAPLPTQTTGRPSPTPPVSPPTVAPVRTRPPVRSGGS